MIGFRRYPRVGDAVQGGGFYGVFASGGIQGGGSVSGVAFQLGSSAGGTVNNLGFGLFFKVSALPASDMMLIDYYAATSGYFRCKLTSAGKVVVESGWSGHVRTLDITNTLTVAATTWYYASGGGRDAIGNWTIEGQVTAGDGSTAGGQNSGFQSDPNFFGSVAATAQLGIGVSLSPATPYLNFPNTAGSALSKIAGRKGTGNTNQYFTSVPSSDQSASGLDFLYLCRDTVGAQATIADSSSNGFTLSAGANGLTVVAAGPYP